LHGLKTPQSLKHFPYSPLLLLFLHQSHLSKLNLNNVQAALSLLYPNLCRDPLKNLQAPLFLAES
jgi:hypothetical protein